MKRNAEQKKKVAENLTTENNALLSSVAPTPPVTSTNISSSEAIAAPAASTTTVNTGAINTQLLESSPLFPDEYQSTLSSSYGVSALDQNANSDVVWSPQQPR